MLKKVKFLIQVLITLFISNSMLLFADPRINSITMVPPSPNFGDRITVTIDYCGQLYNDHEMGVVISTQPDLMDARISGAGQVFIISRAGMNVHTSVPAASPGAEIGWTVNPAPGGVPSDCTDCNSTQGKHYVMVYGDDEVLTVPDADNFPGCNNTTLYLHVGMKDNNLNDGEFHTRAACSEGHYSWSLPYLNTQFTMRKRAEGVVQDPGDLLLFSIDYEYSRGTLTITDNVPLIPGASFELVSFGPQSIVGGTVPSVSPGPIAAGTPLTWVLPNRSSLRGSATGTVWFLLRVVGTPTANGVITNTANGSITGPTGNSASSSTINVTIGKVVITLGKSQAISTVHYGDNVTYFLEYEINGSKLIEYQPFDNIATSPYTNPTPPAGWRYRPEGGAYGTWYVEDTCNTGDRILRGASGNDEYPGLLINRDVSGTGCTGGSVIVTDVLINPAGGVGGNGYEGADAMVAIRDNGATSNGNAYALVLSIDDFIGTNSNGNVGFQVCNPNCSWPHSVNTVQIRGNKWYRVKIETVSEYSFRAKVWEKGSPEPSAWTISYTFTGAETTNMACSNGPWYAGVGQQGGANGTTEDSYNNFVIYQPRASGATHVIDTVPSGIVYGGSSPASTLVSGYRDWSLGTISNEGGTLTWWGKVQTCDPITNRGTIFGTGIKAVDSNEVVTIPICPTPVITLDKTANPMSVAVGDRITFTLHVCNSAAGPAASPFRVWDTIPSQITFGGFVSSSPGVTPSGPTGGMLIWDTASLNAGQCIDMVWWGTLAHFPMNPIEMEKYYFVLNNYLIKSDAVKFAKVLKAHKIDGDEK